MRTRQLICLGICSAALILSGCGKKEGEPAADAGTSATAAATDAAAPAAGSWTPEALEELAAPIALYPDVVLGHVLTASTNPQEVLDAGNWLIEHQDLSGSKLDDEAAKLGLSTSTRALLQFPEVVDMMCMQMDWTTELGQAFTADQAAVLDAVQRLRKQAKDVGNLETSAQLKVETETQDGKEVVTVEPPNKDVVYVPKYDPQAVYAPPPANIPPPTTVNVSGAGTTTVTSADGTTTTVAPATTTAATTTGHSTGSLITTGLLAFGAGMLVNEIFDDDDDWDNYGPNYYHGGMYYGGRPYYPPPPYMYRPPYGNGYYPAHNYNRPPNYQHGFNNNTIIVNNGGNNYWNRQGNGSTNARSRKAQSPITAANPKRNDLDNLNRQASDRSKPESPGSGRQRRVTRWRAPVRLCRGETREQGSARQDGREIPAGRRRQRPAYAPEDRIQGRDQPSDGCEAARKCQSPDRREPTPRNARNAAVAACRIGRSWPRQVRSGAPVGGELRHPARGSRTESGAEAERHGIRIRRRRAEIREIRTPGEPARKGEHGGGGGKAKKPHKLGESR